MKRYEKIVLEAEKDITFEVLEESSGELIIANVYSTNYANPPIPEGYKYVCGEWNNGFVIERIYDGSHLYGFLLEVSTLMEHLMGNILWRNLADGII